MGRAKPKSARATVARKKGESTSVTGGKVRGGGKSLMIVVPPETRAALRARAGMEETTVRVLVLEALKKAGYPVPDADLVDRRRVETGR